MAKILKRLLAMAAAVEDAFPADDPRPEYIISANVLFAAYVQEERNAKAISQQLKATCRAYLLLMDEIKELTERVTQLAKDVKDANVPS